MKYGELVKKLQRLGCEFKRQASGSHEIWVNPRTQRSTSVPHHASKDIGKSLLAKILRELEIDRDDFDRV
ncbi:MAG: type II toxin-antitoxin system HicA family toxin [Chloroflexi bacterium]|nr:type II toxin-antitoxin system HicA family toxin [Chloroflexota bacterium]